MEGSKLRAWTRPATVFPKGGLALRHQVVYFAALIAKCNLNDCMSEKKIFDQKLKYAHRWAIQRKKNLTDEAPMPMSEQAPMTFGFCRICHHIP